MRTPPTLLIALALAGCVTAAQAQMYPPLVDLGHTADIVAFATAIQATEMPGTPPNLTLTIQLHLDRILKGQPASTTLLATVAERQFGGGSGRGTVHVPLSRIAGATGLWFLKTTTDGYDILPRYRAARTVGELCIPVPDSPDVSMASGVDDALLAFAVRWIQSLPEPANTSEDEQFFAVFARGAAPGPTLRQVLSAVPPLLSSPAQWQHIVGLIVSLRAGSPEALTEIANELPGLRTNPRFQEILDVLGHETNSPDLIAPLRQLLAPHSGIPGLDAAEAGALYRIGTQDNTESTWPLVASLLDSKDPIAQMIAARTMAIRVPSRLVSEQTRAFYPGQAKTTEQYVEFWKAWWTQNQANLGFPMSAQ